MKGFRTALLTYQGRKNNFTDLSVMRASRTKHKKIIQMVKSLGFFLSTHIFLFLAGRRLVARAMLGSAC